MEQTIKSFKKCVEQIIDGSDLSEIDDLCFAWLKLSLQDYGKDGKRAITLLNVVQDILEDF